jgi:alkanesulfonate monooxygenase SsuD/methylene tetrahydromethanopterin reductase-like flavin-dependent oxidoreductase (luciferase family)
MKVGYFTMPLHPPGSNMTETLESDLQQIILLDQLGYSEAWIGEHFTAQWENIPAPDLFIAKALALTKDIRLGTGVTCMPNHNPFMIAHRIAQLDHMAKGRFNWGVGSGGFPGDFEVFGFDPQNNDHREMSEQSVELITSMWSDPKPGRYKNKYWDFTIPEPDEELGLKFHVSPYQKPHPPIGVAGVSPNSETLKIAGERGWIPMSINLVPGNVLKGHWEAVAEGAQRSNKKPDRAQWRIAREIFVANTREEAEEEALTGVTARDYNGYFLKLARKTKLLDLFKRDPDMPDSEVTLKYIMDNIWIVGTPDDVTEKIRALYDEVGGFGVLLAMGHEWSPQEKWEHSMKLLSDTVMPRLSDL